MTHTPRAIYTRKKADKWRYIRVGGIGVKGKHHASETGPFYLNVLMGGQPKWLMLNKDGTLTTALESAEGRLANSIPEAIKAADLYDEKQNVKKTAQAQGLTIVPEPGDEKRIALRTAVNHYIEEKEDAGRTPGTIKSYTTILEEFLKMLPSHVRYVDQMVETETNKGIPKRTSSVLKNYMRALKENGASARTVFNKMSVVFFMLKEAGVAQPSKLVTIPDYEEEEAVPYTKSDLKKLFEAMDEDDKFLFCFLLDSACRKGEVAHATWSDVYDGKYHVRNKTYTTAGRNAQTKHFTVKTHEDRRVPLTRELLLMIEERRKTSKSKWIFPNAAGNPENDNGFIRRLKRAAKKAGLICGQCHSELKKADRYGLNPRYEDVCCAKDCQVCEQHYLHRFRRTTATHWHNTGVPIRTVQKWLGHKSLETTMIYLGVKDSEELQTQINAPKY
jgi:integrase